MPPKKAMSENKVIYRISIRCLIHLLKFKKLTNFDQNHGSKNIQFTVQVRHLLYFDNNIICMGVKWKLNFLFID